MLVCQTNGPPKASLQAAATAAMHSQPERCTHPPPPVPAFLLAQNLSSKQIVPTDKTWPIGWCISLQHSTVLLRGLEGCRWYYEEPRSFLERSVGWFTCRSCLLVQYMGQCNANKTKELECLCTGFSAFCRGYINLSKPSLGLLMISRTLAHPSFTTSVCQKLLNTQERRKQT